MTKTGGKKLICLSIFVAVVIAEFLVTVLALDTTIVTAGVFIILETLLAALLKKTPIFVHGAVLLALIAAGFMAGKGVLMIALAVVYVAALVTLTVFLEE